MVKRSVISIFAMAFIYFLIWLPTPTHRRIHFKKLQLCPCSVRYLGQVLLIAGFRLEAWAQLCWDWFLPHRKLREVWTRSENCLTHLVLLTLACALVSFLAAAFSLSLCGSVVLWFQSLWPCGGCSNHVWAQLHALTFGQVLGPRPSHKQE